MANPWHEIWIEQCDAAESIRRRFGTRSALEYLVSEKLISFAEAAQRDPDFARALPRFVSRIRQIFTVQEITLHLSRLERERLELESLPIEDEDDDPRHRFATDARRARHMASIRKLLTAPILGTS